MEWYGIGVGIEKYLFAWMFCYSNNKNSSVNTNEMPQDECSKNCINIALITPFLFIIIRLSLRINYEIHILRASTIDILKHEQISA